MANQFSGLISSDLKLLFTNIIDSLLEDQALTVPCRLIFSGTKFIKCPNCNFNSITGKSANTYLAGGPRPFTKGTCPYCNGDGRISDTNDSDIVNLAVIWEPRKFLPVAKILDAGQMGVQTICSISLLPTLKKANEIIVDTNIEKYVKHKFQRDSEPVPIGLGADQYIVTLWTKTG